jgi:glutamate-1-semialdehyde aminotransferase
MVLPKKFLETLAQPPVMQSPQPETFADSSEERWPGFQDVLRNLHREGVYIHPEQLAEFFVMHGLPVDLCYVPDHLQERAKRINDNYQGDMARLEVL